MVGICYTHTQVECSTVECSTVRQTGSVPFADSGGVAEADTHGPDLGMVDGSDATDPPVVCGQSAHVHTQTYTHTYIQYVTI